MQRHYFPQAICAIGRFRKALWKLEDQSLFPDRPSRMRPLSTFSCCDTLARPHTGKSHLWSLWVGHRLEGSGPSCPPTLELPGSGGTHSAGRCAPPSVLRASRPEWHHLDSSGCIQGEPPDAPAWAPSRVPDPGFTPWRSELAPGGTARGRIPPAWRLPPLVIKGPGLYHGSGLIASAGKEHAGGTWGALSGKRPALDFGSGRELGVLGLSPASGSAFSRGCWRLGLCLPLLTHMHTLSK
ncbi:hypothetical protein VULLAG_LOCUS14145 [Vulpes lagopus]